MREDIGLSLQVPASPGDVYVAVFTLVFVGLLTVLALPLAGVEMPVVLGPVIAALVVAVIGLGAKIYRMAN